MYKRRYTLLELKNKIKEMEEYIGPLVDYNSDIMPEKYGHTLLMEYLDLLKRRYYKRLNLVKSST